ncbi:hypothetical protein Tco_0550340 [Tanacetum coccineum]
MRVISPKTSHLLAVKRIFRYLKGKPSLGLWYSKDSPLKLVAYTDSDFAGATLDRKSTTGVPKPPVRQPSIESSNLEKPDNPPIVMMADNRTMAQLLEAPTEGYEDAIVIPEITANNFEIKHGLLIKKTHMLTSVISTRSLLL